MSIPRNLSIIADTLNSDGTFASISNTGSTTLSSGTANGVSYLNGSKVLTTGSALTFDGGANLSTGGSNAATYNNLNVNNTSSTGYSRVLFNIGSAGANGVGVIKYAPGIFFAIGTDSDASSTPITFNLNGAEYMRISVASGGVGAVGIGYTSLTSVGNNGLAVAGNVGIGLTNPTYKLNVTSTSASAAFFQTTSAATWAANTSDTVFQAYNSTTTNNATALYGASVNYGDGTYTGVKFGAVASGAYSADFVVANRNGGTFQENVRITASGNVGIGTTPSAWRAGARALQLGSSGYASLNEQANGSASLNFNCYESAVNTWTYLVTGVAPTRYTQLSGTHNWFNAPSGTAGGTISFTQAMTLDASGNLLVGTTAQAVSPTIGVQLNNASGTIGYVGIGHATGTATGNYYATFNYAGGLIGSITQSGTTAVLFNVTSDQRLKENIQDAESASALIDSLQVRQFDWKSDNTHQRYGFVAQELVTVAPEAVHQPADPEAMMAVDYSKLVPMLVKEIQSLRKRLTALESKEIS